MPHPLQAFWDQLGTLRCPVGLILFKAEQYHLAAEAAARSGATPQDFRESGRAMIPPNGRYVDFRPDTLVTALRKAHDASPTRRLLVQNFDLGLARLKFGDRLRLWSSLVSNFPPNSKTSVALALPDEETAAHLLPAPDLLGQWLESKRAFRFLP